MDLKLSSNFQKLLAKVNVLKQFISGISKTSNKNSSEIKFINEYINAKVSSLDEYNKLLLKRIESLEKEVNALKSVLNREQVKSLFIDPK